MPGVYIIHLKVQSFMAQLNVIYPIHVIFGEKSVSNTKPCKYNIALYDLITPRYRHTIASMHRHKHINAHCVQHLKSKGQESSPLIHHPLMPASP